MEKIIATGKTVEEAINAALRQLNTTEDKVNVRIVEQPGKRFFGLMGRKDAVVEVSLINPSSLQHEEESQHNSAKENVEVKTTVAEQQKQGSLDEAQYFLQDVFKTMGITVQIEVSKEDGQIVFNFVGKDLGILIGRRGQTLDSLQYLTNIVANRYTKEGRVRIVLDAEHYRSRRKATLEDLASKLAERVIRTGKEVVLEPMSPHERKIIHTKLQNHPKVETHSQGEEPNRKVLITRKY